MRIKGIATLGAIAFTVTTFFAVPVSATATVGQRETVSSRTAVSEPCSENIRAGADTRSTDECATYSYWIWDILPYGRYSILKLENTDECLTANLEGAFPAQCRPHAYDQLWLDVTPPDSVGARRFRSVAYPDVCVILRIGSPSERG